MTGQPVPTVEGVITAERIASTVDSIAEVQLATGMIPWFPDGHADPWNHVEAAMALAIGGPRRPRPSGPTSGSSTASAPDGAWHQYYLADRRGGVQARRQRVRLRGRRRRGTTSCSPATPGSSTSMWPVVDAAVEFVLGLQTPRGEILWARHDDGTPWSFALLTGSSSICHSLRCAIAIAEHLGQERPDWELSAAQLAHVVAHVPDAFEPKAPLGHGLVLPGAGRRGGRAMPVGSAWPSGWDALRDGRAGGPAA